MGTTGARWRGPQWPRSPCRADKGSYRIGFRCRTPACTNGASLVGAANVHKRSRQRRRPTHRWKLCRRRSGSVCHTINCPAASKIPPSVYISTQNMKIEAIPSVKNQLRALARLLQKMRQAPGNADRSLLSFVKVEEFQFSLLMMHCQSC